MKVTVEFTSMEIDWLCWALDLLPAFFETARYEHLQPFVEQEEATEKCRELSVKLGKAKFYARKNGRA